MFYLVVNYIGYSLCWYLLVCCASRYISLVVGLVILHLACCKLKQLELATIASVVPLGIGLDTMLTYIGVFNFSPPHYILPIWFCLLWVLLSCVLNHCMRFIKQLSYGYIALLGTVSAPLAYAAGARTSQAFDFGYSGLMSMCIIGVVWSIVLPLIVFIVRYLERCYGPVVSQAH